MKNNCVWTKQNSRQRILTFVQMSKLIIIRFGLGHSLMKHHFFSKLLVCETDHCLWGTATHLHNKLCNPSKLTSKNANDLAWNYWGIKAEQRLGTSTAFGSYYHKCLIVQRTKSIQILIESSIITECSKPKESSINLYQKRPAIILVL